jgi:AraC-like DNA-binding protein
MRITVKKITDYLTDHINEMTDIEKMAEALMISRSYLSRKCRELTGLSVQQLHEKLKIEQAKNMLALQRFELSEIASTLGFKSQNYFSNVFKKNTGLSPLNWIKKN